MTKLDVTFSYLLLFLRLRYQSGGRPGPPSRQAEARLLFVFVFVFVFIFWMGLFDGLDRGGLTIFVDVFLVVFVLAMTVVIAVCAAAAVPAWNKANAISRATVSLMNFSIVSRSVNVVTFPPVGLCY